MVVRRMDEDELAAVNGVLAGQHPEAILRWAVRRFGRKLTMATAFGAEGCCLIHLLAGIDLGVRIFNLDTGYQFPETLELRERILQRYGIAVEFVRAQQSVAEYEEEHGGQLFELRRDQCCHDRKIVRLRRAVAGYDAWVSAIRRDQTKDRAVAEAVQWDAKFRLVKVNPLLNWTRKDVWDFIVKH